MHYPAQRVSRLENTLCSFATKDCSTLCLFVLILRSIVLILCLLEQSTKAKSNCKHDKRAAKDPSQHNQIEFPNSQNHTRSKANIIKTTTTKMVSQSLRSLFCYSSKPKTIQPTCHCCRGKLNWNTSIAGNELLCSSCRLLYTSCKRCTRLTIRSQWIHQSGRAFDWHPNCTSCGAGTPEHDNKRPDFRPWPRPSEVVQTHRCLPGQKKDQLPPIWRNIRRASIIS
jgi:hypothetical protein